MLKTLVAKQPRRRRRRRRRHPHPATHPSCREKWVSRFNKGRCLVHLVIYTARRDRDIGSLRKWHGGALPRLGRTWAGDTEASEVWQVPPYKHSTNISGVIKSSVMPKVYKDSQVGW